MRVILLSGGSGKRLWPLSNEIRSKQFLKLFVGESGEYESMLQRVYRQISNTIDAQITIATSNLQACAIANQLDGKVTVSIEPCRRDTFPAIALSVAYLKYELGAGDDECVAVCPVDPYVDDSYYKTVGDLEKIAGEMRDGIVLMGVEPTCPSEKYGYIIPETKERVSKVSSFKEKPDTKTAESYIERGALWNAGVFAFRLGYLLDKARQMAHFKDYRDLYERYESAPNISFDYAVVEKEENVRVVRYQGEWKDVGTWGAMSEVLPYSSKGNATLDDECRNTQVINELSIPVVCMGCKNMIVAVGEDGILVADKQRSDCVKPYAEKVSLDSRIAEQDWGDYRVLDEDGNSKTVRLHVCAGKSMSDHARKECKKVWTVLSGTGIFTADGEKRNVVAGDSVEIAVNCIHMLLAVSDMVVLESQINGGSEVVGKAKG